MFENVRADTMRCIHRSGLVHAIDILRLLWASEGFQVLLIYRFGRWLGRVRKYRFGWFIVVPLYPAYWMLSVCARKAYDIHLDQSADIAAGFYIHHFGGIEVRNCRIGSRCTIYQQVKLGPAEGADRGPVIGDGVFISAHTQICSDVRVEDGATIGAATVITEDIPNHCLVLGNPSRIVQRDYDNSKFL